MYEELNRLLSNAIIECKMQEGMFDKIARTFAKQKNKDVDVTEPDENDINKIHKNGWTKNYQTALKSGSPQKIHNIAKSEYGSNDPAYSEIKIAIASNPNTHHKTLSHLLNNHINDAISKRTQSQDGTIGNGMSTSYHADLLAQEIAKHKNTSPLTLAHLFNNKYHSEVVSNNSLYGHAGKMLEVGKHISHSTAHDLAQNSSNPDVLQQLIHHRDTNTHDKLLRNPAMTHALKKHLSSAYFLTKQQNEKLINDPETQHDTLQNIHNKGTDADRIKIEKHTNFKGVPAPKLDNTSDSPYR